MARVSEYNLTTVFRLMTHLSDAGFTPEEIRLLVREDQLLKLLHESLHGRAVLQKIERYPVIDTVEPVSLRERGDGLGSDLPYSGKLFANQVRGSLELNPDLMDFRTPVSLGISEVRARKVLDALHSKPVLNEAVLRGFLANQHCIPVHLRAFRICFPGTVYKDRWGVLHIPYMSCSQDYWLKRWVWTQDYKAIGPRNVWRGGVLVALAKE